MYRHIEWKAHQTRPDIFYWYTIFCLQNWTKQLQIYIQNSWQKFPAKPAELLKFYFLFFVLKYGLILSENR